MPYVVAWRMRSFRLATLARRRGETSRMLPLAVRALISGDAARRRSGAPEPTRRIVLGAPNSVSSPNSEGGEREAKCLVRVQLCVGACRPPFAAGCFSLAWGLQLKWCMRSHSLPLRLAPPPPRRRSVSLMLRMARATGSRQRNHHDRSLLRSVAHHAVSCGAGTRPSRRVRRERGIAASRWIVCARHTPHPPARPLGSGPKGTCRSMGDVAGQKPGHPGDTAAPAPICWRGGRLSEVRCR